MTKNNLDINKEGRKECPGGLQCCEYRFENGLNELKCCPCHTPVQELSVCCGAKSKIHDFFFSKTFCVNCSKCGKPFQAQEVLKEQIKKWDKKAEELHNGFSEKGEEKPCGSCLTVHGDEYSCCKMHRYPFNKYNGSCKWCRSNMHPSSLPPESSPMEWEEAFERGFSFEGNNDPESTPKMMFIIHEDGTKSLATPEYVKGFIKVALRHQIQRSAEQEREKTIKEIIDLSFHTLDRTKEDVQNFNKALLAIKKDNG